MADNICIIAPIKMAILFGELITSFQTHATADKGTVVACRAPPEDGIDKTWSKFRGEQTLKKSLLLEC
jgi:hypothetical protein